MGILGIPEISQNDHKNGLVVPTTVKTLNIGTPRRATVVVLNMKQFNFTMK